MSGIDPLPVTATQREGEVDAVLPGVAASPVAALLVEVLDQSLTPRRSKSSACCAVARRDIHRMDYMVVVAAGG